MPDPLPISFRHARALARSLADLGLRHVIVSPGSRSTPLVLAFHELDVVEKTVVLDERVAAFTALGISRATGFPAALLCTSGTAAANYYPAVIEARQSGIPLLVITADRSNLDRRNGAPQSMIQPGMYGVYTVFDYDAALPDTDESLKRLEYAAWQALDAAIHLAGPAHINIPFDKPLEPQPGLPTTQPASPTIRRRLAMPPLPVVTPSDLPEPALAARRPVVVAGPAYGSPALLSAWVDALEGTGIPVLASHTSGLSHSRLAPERIREHHRLLRSPAVRESLKPDLIIRLGHFPTSKSLELYLEQHASVPEWSVLPAGASGSPHNPSGFRLYGAPSSGLLRQLSAQMDAEWPTAWGGGAYKRSVAAEGVLTDGAVHRLVLGRLHPGEAVFVSNSLPVRDFDVFGADWDSDHNRVFSARGVSGIDGVTSQALGVALGGSCDTVLITGDLAFLHDSNALMLNGSIAHQRVLVVVINNGGGQIFRTLPIASYGDLYDQYFGTPQRADIGQLCKAHGVIHKKATNAAEVRLALDELQQSKGIVVLECITDPQASMAERQS